MVSISLLVVGSVNLDIVATAAHLPAPGETISDAVLARHPGGKGANQALAAHRLGARVALSASVGRDPEAEQALALLSSEGVDLSHCITLPGCATGVALICVESSGENQIVVAPGANAQHRLPDLDWSAYDGVICQLEIPIPVIEQIPEHYSGFLCVNLAPARRVPDAVLQRADLLVVNESEARFAADRLHLCDGWIATTEGAKGAVLSRHRGGEDRETFRADAPAVATRDTTGAGDTFTAALTLALLEGMPPETALGFACAAGACATRRMGAQPSLPGRSDVDRLCR